MSLSRSLVEERMQLLLGHFYGKAMTASMLFDEEFWQHWSISPPNALPKISPMQSTFSIREQLLSAVQHSVQEHMTTEDIHLLFLEAGPWQQFSSVKNVDHVFSCDPFIISTLPSGESFTFFAYSSQNQELLHHKKGRWHRALSREKDLTWEPCLPPPFSSLVQGDGYISNNSGINALLSDMKEHSPLHLIDFGIFSSHLPASLELDKPLPLFVDHVVKVVKNSGKSVKAQSLMNFLEEVHRQPVLSLWSLYQCLQQREQFETFFPLDTMIGGDLLREMCLHEQRVGYSSLGGKTLLNALRERGFLSWLDALPLANGHYLHDVMDQYHLHLCHVLLSDFIKRKQYWLLDSQKQNLMEPLSQMRYGSHVWEHLLSLRPLLAQNLQLVHMRIE